MVRYGLWSVALLAVPFQTKEYGWDGASEDVHGEYRCSAEGILGGADYFAHIARLLRKATRDSEIVFIGWSFEVLAPLLGFPAPQDVNYTKFKSPHLSDANPQNIMEKQPENFPTFKGAIIAAAERGAHIYIQTWRTSVFSEILSGAKKTMHAFKHPNIHVFLDDGRTWSTKFFWSSHTKAVVFDRKLAFVSGIDFAAQRFDSFSHMLPDVRRFIASTYEGLAAWTDFGNAQSWQEWGLKFNGHAALNVAKVARLRQKSYCLKYHGKPKCYEEHMIPDIAVYNSVKNYSDPYAIEDHLVDITGDKKHDREGTCTLQVNGAYDLYGLKERTLIIGDDFAKAVEEAEHYIYVESQYFVAKGFKEPEPMFGYSAENPYAQAIARRLQRAARECDTNFSVIIVTPLAPVEGWYIYLTWKTIFEKQYGLQDVLVKALEEAKTNGTNDKNGKKDKCNFNIAEVTEHMLRVSWIGQVNRLTDDEKIFFPIFTHSKIMMTEKYFSSGSANFNDRSLLGRDNELNVAVRGKKLIRHLLQTYFLPYLGERGYQKFRTTLDERGSIGKLFTEFGRENNEFMKQEMKLDVERGFDLDKKRCKDECRLYDVKQPVLLALRANGREWFTRKLDLPEQMDTLHGFFFNNDPNVFGNVENLDSAWVHWFKAFF